MNFPGYFQWTKQAMSGSRRTKEPRMRTARASGSGPEEPGFWRFMQSATSFFEAVLTTLKDNPRLGVLWGVAVLIFFLLVAIFVLAGDIPPTGETVVALASISIPAALFVFTIWHHDKGTVKPDTRQGQHAAADLLASRGPPAPPIIASPRILIAAAKLFASENMRLEDNIEAVTQLSGSPPIVARNVTSEQLRALLTESRFDIIHLLVYVEDRSLKLIFSIDEKGDRLSPDDILSSDGFAKLVEVTGAKLVLLATPDSIKLGAVLSQITSVIAGYSEVTVNDFISWEKSFFSLLAKQMPLSKAFDISQVTTGVPLRLLLRDDLAFKV